MDGGADEPEHPPHRRCNGSWARSPRCTPTQPPWRTTWKPKTSASPPYACGRRLGRHRRLDADLAAELWRDRSPSLASAARSRSAELRSTASRCGRSKANSNRKRRSSPASADPPSVYGYSHREVIRDFAHAVLHGEQPHTTGEEARKSLELVLAIYRSARTGQEVALPLADK